MALSFSFDTSKGETPESVASRRKSADALAARIFGRTPQNMGEGLNALGQAFIARQMTDEANASDSAGRASAAAAFNPIAASIIGQGATPAAPVAAAPMGGLPAMPAQGAGIVQDDGNAAPGTVGMNQRLADQAYDFIDDNPGTSVSSGMRSTADQARLYAARDSNPNPVAPPGTSRHEVGSAVDIAGMTPASRAMLPQYGLGQPVANDPPHVELARPTMLASADDGADLPSNAAPAQGMLPTAQAVQGAPRSAAAPGPTMEMLVKAQSNPWLTDGQRTMINTMVKQKLDEEAQARDPLRQGQIAESRARLDMMPLERDSKVLSNDRARRDLTPLNSPYKDDDGNLVQSDASGKVSVLNAAEKAPTSVQEYNFYRANLPPGTQPMDYGTFSTAKARAAATNITNNVGGDGETAFDKEAAKLQAGRYNDLIVDGQKSKQMMADMSTLLDLGKGIKTGKSAQFRAAIGPYADALNIKVDKLEDIQAYEAIVNRMAPSLRVAGSGAQSDYELKNFLKSIPSLGNTTEGNELATTVMSGLQQNKILAADIASKVINKEVTRQEGEKQLRELPDPMQPYRDYRKNKSNVDNLLQKYGPK
jgi:hypothetical protein